MADSAPPAATPGPPRTQDDHHSTVVGIGASAGGLAALKTLFQNVPPDSGLAWVVVVHLSPEHESHLAELLQPHVGIPVQQVSETVPLEPDRVYVIPPNANLNTIDTHLRLSALEARRQERAPIDHFLRTLARTHDGHAVGVILSGTGSDGTLGLREIKEKGGLTVVQDPREAEYDGMPQSAIATGIVDEVLPLAKIPAAILGFARTHPEVSVPESDEAIAAEEQRLLQKVFARIRGRTGHDFSRYKRNTMLRRIRRRMQIRRVLEMDEYLEILREEPEEILRLVDDLLITVTSFFRDPEVFEALERDVIPALLEGRSPDETVRVWSVGCATGEEAYSFAMLLMEEAGRREAPPRVQIFASDLHERSLERARHGFYPGDIATDVSPERLRRFFTEEEGGYRIRPEVRELVVFSPHNLLGDPPFSRLDLIACRNVLIYLDRDVQGDVVDLFHYALRGDGYLVLGTSETVETRELFHVHDKAHCIYRRRNVPPPEPRLPVFPLPRHRRPIRERSGEAGEEPLAYGELHQRIVERYGPPSMLVNPDDRVVHVSEHAGRYLVFPGGEPTTNAYRVVREELRIELRSALGAARRREVPVQTRPQLVRFNGERGLVVMDVRPALDPGQDGYALVHFMERPALEPAQRSQAPAAPEAALEWEEDGDAPEGTAGAERIAELELEVQQSGERLQSIIEEYETSQEELRASNEELQSSNEELRSTMEELETSKEELQSMNEELQTVNQENRHKVEELSQMSGDLQNLLAATDIATLFLDRQLRIMRYTPRVAELFNVRPVDRGRPVRDLTHRLDYDDLQEDARRVLDRLVPVEREVRDEDGLWYLTRVLPYRSQDDRIEGVVVTFVEITARRRAEEALRASEAHQAFLVRLSDGVRTLADAEAIRARACRLLGEQLAVDRAYYVEVDEEAGEARVDHDYLRGRSPSLVGTFRLDEVGWTLPYLRRGERVVVEDTGVDPRVPEGDRSRMVELATRAHVSVPVLKEGALLGALCVTEPTPRAWTAEEVALVEDVAERIWAAVERVRAETALRASEERYRTLFESMDQGYCVVEVLFSESGEAEDYRFLEVNPAFEVETGLADPVGKRMRELAPGHEEHWFEIFGRIARTGESERFVAEARQLGDRWFDVYAFRIGEAEERKVAVLFEDISEQRRTELALRQSEMEFRALVNASMDVVYRMSPDWSELRRLEGRGFLPDVEEPRDDWRPLYLDPGELPRFDEAVREAIRTKDVFELEHRVRRVDGTMGWTLSRAVPILDEGGEIIEWVGAAADVTDRKEAEVALERRVAERTREVRHLAETLSRAEQQERERLSRLLHDDLQQLLYGIQIKLTLALDEAEREAPGAALDQGRQTLELIDQAIQRTRQLTVDLNPPILEGEGLAEALEWLRTQMRELHGLQVEIEADAEVEIAAPDLRILLFQVARELLFNVAKHAGTDGAVVEVRGGGGRVRVVVRDDGEGFDPAELDRSQSRRVGLGLVSGRERLRMRGGGMEIESAPGTGTRVTAWVPLEASP